MPTMRRSSRGRGASFGANNASSANEASNWTGASSPLSSLSTPGSPAEPQEDSDASAAQAAPVVSAVAVAEAEVAAAQADALTTPMKRHRQSSDSEAKAPVWRPGKRGRPPKNASAVSTPLRDSEGDDISDGMGGVMGGRLANGDEDESDDDEAERDAAGEAKIDADGYLQGGREFICEIFKSPFRRNKARQYVLTMDCCRYMGARDSYMLFKQHPRMKRVETTQEERNLLADKRMIPKVTRFRPIALITARTAFREFGARIVKDGKYITDDYWESRCRKEMKHPEGTVVADMSVYHSVQAAHAAGVTPGSTRKQRKMTPLRSPTGQGGSSMLDSPLLQHSQHHQQQQQHIQLGQPRMMARQQSASSSAVMVNSWVQLEAQQRQSAPSQPSTALTLASALQQQQQQPPQQLQFPQQLHRQQQQQQQQQHLAAGMLAAPTQMQILQQAGGLDGESDSDGRDDAALPPSAPILSKPVFRSQRSREISEAAFDATVAIHRAQAADDHGFVDGTPLVRSLAGSWARATSLSNKLARQQKQRSAGKRPSSSLAAGSADADAAEDDAGWFGPMAYASAKMARDLNASIRLWREDNGCTWVDPHTAVRQVPADLQPTAASASRVSREKGAARRVDPRIHFVSADAASQQPDADAASSSNQYPLALLPGQFQESFPIYRTRFGQSGQQAVQSYAHQWLRQLSLQTQSQTHSQRQQQQHLQQQQQQQHLQHHQLQRRATGDSLLRSRRK
ncbi:chromatin structure-remodeling complex subunit RSC7 [Coemansia sp. Benny D160-2]|nr:chromatin structure-remodeling complex subunit RSC7 [Coemansia sp. Benny D160-2]